jgi:hypothetical protein
VGHSLQGPKISNFKVKPMRDIRVK